MLSFIQFNPGKAVFMPATFPPSRWCPQIHVNLVRETAKIYKNKYLKTKRPGAMVKDSLTFQREKDGSVGG